MLQVLKVYTVDPSEVRGPNETATLISESSLLKCLRSYGWIDGG